MILVKTYYPGYCFKRVAKRNETPLFFQCKSIKDLKSVKFIYISGLSNPRQLAKIFHRRRWTIHGLWGHGESADDFESDFEPWDEVKKECKNFLKFGTLRSPLSGMMAEG